jgi:hypothetical protein
MLIFLINLLLSFSIMISKCFMSLKKNCLPFLCSVEMDEKVDLVEVLTRRVEDLQRGKSKTHITSVHCATQHKIVICTYFSNQCHHISYYFFLRCLLMQFSVDQLFIL